MFSRKTYFYPDLAKNYQITQYEIPLGSNGKVELPGKEILLSRIHIEEDPAALEHHDGYCLADYNRSGNPLIEIVTAPIIESPAEARDFLKALASVLSYLHVFDASGTMKADANISIARTGFTRVEIKNITGFKEVERALSYEIRRQQSHDVSRETRGWDADKGLTYPLRAKESEEDYGYILDPDLPAIVFEKSALIDAAKELPELPRQKAERWASLGVDRTDASIIASDAVVAGQFDAVNKKINPALAAKWFRREYLRILNETEKPASDFDAEKIIELLKLVEEKNITDRTGQQLFDLLGKNPRFETKQFVEENRLVAVSDDGVLKQYAETVLQQNPKAIQDFRAGEDKALNFLVGQVMKVSRGTATPDKVKEILLGILQ